MRILTVNKTYFLNLVFFDFTKRLRSQKFYRVHCSFFADFVSIEMSIVEHFESDGLWILDHAEHIRETYRDAKLRSKDLFDVKSPFYMDLQAERIAKEMEGACEEVRKKRKRKFESCSSPDVLFVRKKFESVRKSVEHLFEPPPSADVIRLNNRSVRKTVADLSPSDNFVRNSTFSGSNDSDTCQLSANGNVEFVIPPKSRFQVDDLINFRSDKTFDVVLMDPPWENKHVKRVNVRGKGYDVLSTDSMSSHLSNFFTGSQFFRTNGILLTWVSNSGKQQDALLGWAQSWNLTLRAKWFWLKVGYSFTFLHHDSIVSLA